jgi:hypothetical protein
MRKVVTCAGLVGGCAAFAVAAGCVSTPQLEYDGAAIGEIVQRVKCELAYAVPDVRGRYSPGKEFQWMKYWTAKVDLNLQTTDTSNFQPTASFISFDREFTFGAGAGLKNEAYLNDKMSFTLSLDELSGMRRDKECVFAQERGLLGHLGLGDWVRSALAPVRGRQLAIGYHQPPNAKPVPIAGPISAIAKINRRGAAGAVAARDVVTPAARTAICDFCRARSQIGQASAFQSCAEDSIRAGIGQADLAARHARTKMPGRLSEWIKRTYDAASDAGGSADRASAFLDTAAVLAWRAKAALREVKPVIKDLKDKDAPGYPQQKPYLTAVDAELTKFLGSQKRGGDGPGGHSVHDRGDADGRGADRSQAPAVVAPANSPGLSTQPICTSVCLAIPLPSMNKQCPKPEQVALGDDPFGDIEARQKDDSSQAGKIRDGASAAWALLPQDPPIDSITHDVKFTVTASANASPNWTLVRFRGPAQSSTFASLQRQRINELTIVMGEPAEPGGKELSDEQSRQLWNNRLDSRGAILIPAQ